MEPLSLHLLRRYGPEAGLAPVLHPWPRQGTLRERWARNPLLMAPMAGVTDAAYRLMARAGGAALAYSEMVSVNGVHYGGAKTWELVDPDPAEPELAVQLFGSDPERFAEAACLVQERLGDRLALLDVNMACPVPKVTKKGEGSALLSDPERAAAIVRACASHCSVPVTVKARIGRRPDEPVPDGFWQRLQEAGAAALAIHGRFASQFYRGESNDGPALAAARLLSIPVVATGDVLEPERCRALRDAGVAAVFVARGSEGDPWFFSRALASLEGCASVSVAPEPAAPVPAAVEPTLAQRMAAFRLHLRLLEATGAHLARARSLAGWYLRGFPDAARCREQAMRCTTVEQYCELTHEAVALAEQALEP